MLTLRTLQRSRFAMVSVVIDAFVVSSSSQRRLRAIAATNVARVSERIRRTFCEKVGQDVDHVDRFELAIGADRQALVRELIDHIEHPVLAAIMGAVLDEVVGPDMVGRGGFFRW